MMPTLQISETSTFASPPPTSSARSDAASGPSGWWGARGWSQEGIVSTGTKALERYGRNSRVKGLPHDQVTVGVSGREAHGRVHDGLVFDGGQSAQAGLPAAAVIGPLDPGNDRDPELLSGPPALAVQDVLLEQRKEGLHRGVVASGTDLPHRSDEVVTVQSVHELPRPKLRPAVRMHDAASDATAAGSGVVQGVHRQTRLHPGVHGVADDPAGEHVLDGAEVEL